MTLHARRTHPTPVVGCFGCKVGSLGVDTGQRSRVIRHRGTPDGPPATITEHRDGRQDVNVFPPTVRLRTSVREDQ